MVAKNLEMNVAVLVVFELGVDILERNSSPVLCLSCEHEKPTVGPATCPIRSPIPLASRLPKWECVLALSHSLPPSPRVSGLLLPSPAAPVRPLSLFSPLFHSSRARLAGNPISGRQFHYPKALRYATMSSHSSYGPSARRWYFWDPVFG